MDPLSATAGVIAVLQATNVVLTLLYTVRSALTTFPESLFQLIEETRALRNILEGVQDAIAACAEGLPAGEITPRYRACQQLENSIREPLGSSLAQLSTLERKIRSDELDAVLGSKRKAVLHALAWRLRDDETKEAVARLERCKASLSIAISAYNS
jgi:hypothetical protein